MHVGVKTLLVVATCLNAVEASAEHVSLINSPRAFAEARQIAEENNLQFFVTPAQIERAVRQGRLVDISKNRNIIFTGSFPYVLPGVARRLNHLSESFAKFCRQPLGVTSAVRAEKLQPKQAAPNSLHRTGMATDLHIPDKPECKTHLWEDLKLLENEGILHAWIEEDRRFPHFHVAINIDTPDLPDLNLVPAAAVPTPKEEPKPTLWQTLGTYVPSLPTLPSISFDTLVSGSFYLVLWVYIYFMGRKVVKNIRLRSSQPSR